MFRAGILILVAALTAPAAIQGKSPSHKQIPTNTTSQRQQDQRGTAEAPLVVTIQTADESEQEARKSAEYREREASDREITWWAKLAVGAGVAQTIALVITFGVMGFFGVRQLRAYVTVIPQRIDNIAPDKKARGVFTIRNGGMTPAHKVRHFSMIAPLENPLPEGRKIINPVNESADEGMPIHAGTEITGTVDLKFPLTEAQLAALLKTDVMRLYIVAIVKYRDIFGFSRRTEVCASLSQEELRRTAKLALEGKDEEADVHFEFARYHNKAT